jgi:hypothetical protein
MLRETYRYKAHEQQVVIYTALFSLPLSPKLKVDTVNSINPDYSKLLGEFSSFRLELGKSHRNYHHLLLKPLRFVLEHYLYFSLTTEIRIKEFTYKYQFCVKTTLVNLLTDFLVL